jgi:cobalamin synthase
MEGIWPKIIKATGSVGVVAFLFYTVLNYVFSAQIVALFGSEKIFLLTIAIISALLILLLVSILKSKENSENANQSDGPKVTYKGRSTHNGDNNF